LESFSLIFYYGEESLSRDEEVGLALSMFGPRRHVEVCLRRGEGGGKGRRRRKRRRRKRRRRTMMSLLAKWKKKEEKKKELGKSKFKSLQDKKLI
jgi:hypothetical protein